jgi:hypothetical protein
MLEKPSTNPLFLLSTELAGLAFLDCLPDWRPMAFVFTFALWHMLVHDYTWHAVPFPVLYHFFILSLIAGLCHALVRNSP